MASSTSDFQTSNSAWFGNQNNDRWAELDESQAYYDYYDPGFKQFCFEKLAELKNLRPGWDYQNAPAIDRDVIKAVHEFLASLPDHIAVRPMVIPMSNGTVQLEWHHGKKLALELEFESPQTVHFLKWDPENQIEDEDVIPASKREELVSFIRWFMKGMLSG